MKETSIEIQRKNVTIEQFFKYLNKQCAKKGLEFHMEIDSFVYPIKESLSSYKVIDGKKHCYNENYRTFTRSRRKIASNGGFYFYYTNEFEDYEETELCSAQSIFDADYAPCQAEISRTFACNYQTYILNFEGMCYNEICEFNFDNGNLGQGYYYQFNRM